MANVDKGKLIEHLDAHIKLPTAGLSYADDAMKAGRRHAYERLRDHVLDGVFDTERQNLAMANGRYVRKDGAEIIVEDGRLVGAQGRTIDEVELVEVSVMKDGSLDPAIRVTTKDKYLKTVDQDELDSQAAAIVFEAQAMGEPDWDALHDELDGFDDQAVSIVSEAISERLATDPNYIPFVPADCGCDLHLPECSNYVGAEGDGEYPDDMSHY